MHLVKNFDVGERLYMFGERFEMLMCFNKKPRWCAGFKKCQALRPGLCSLVFRHLR